MRQPGLEPGSPRWQREILTTILPAHKKNLGSFYEISYKSSLINLTKELVHNIGSSKPISILEFLPFCRIPAFYFLIITCNP